MVAWHPSGELLASASYDDTVKLWADQGDEWECVQTLSGAPPSPSVRACHPPARWSHRSVREGRISIRQSDVRERVCQSISLVPQRLRLSEWLARKIGSGEVECDGTPVSTSPGPGIGHTSTVWAVAFSPDGSRMVSCGDDRCVKIWWDTRGAHALFKMSAACSFRRGPLRSQLGFESEMSSSVLRSFEFTFNVPRSYL